MVVDIPDGTIVRGHATPVGPTVTVTILGIENVGATAGEIAVATKLGSNQGLCGSSSAGWGWGCTALDIVTHDVVEKLF